MLVGSKEFDKSALLEGLPTRSPAGILKCTSAIRYQDGPMIFCPVGRRVMLASGVPDWRARVINCRELVQSSPTPTAVEGLRHAVQVAVRGARHGTCHQAQMEVIAAGWGNKLVTCGKSSVAVVVSVCSPRHLWCVRWTRTRGWS
jgi:hypothetical protein